MSLPAGQQRALNKMDKRLCSSDPGLASLFGTFTRLTWDEVMPSQEKLGAGLLVRCLRAARLKPILFFPIALAAMVCAVFIGVGGRGTQKCSPTPSLQRSSPVSPPRVFGGVGSGTRTRAPCQGAVGTSGRGWPGLPGRHPALRAPLAACLEKRPAGAAPEDTPAIKPGRRYPQFRGSFTASNHPRRVGFSATMHDNRCLGPGWIT